MGQSRTRIITAFMLAFFFVVVLIVVALGGLLGNVETEATRVAQSYQTSTREAQATGTALRDLGLVTDIALTDQAIETQQVLTQAVLNRTANAVQRLTDNAPTPSYTPTDEPPTATPSATPTDVCSPSFINTQRFYTYPGEFYESFVVENTNNFFFEATLDDSSWYQLWDGNNQRGWIAASDIQQIPSCAENSGIVPVILDYRANDQAIGDVIIGDNLNTALWNASVVSGQMRITGSFQEVELIDEEFELPDNFYIEVVLSMPESGTFSQRTGVILRGEERIFYGVSVGRPDCALRLQTYTTQIISDVQRDEDILIANSTCNLSSFNLLSVERNNGQLSVWLNGDRSETLSVPDEANLSNGTISLYVFNNRSQEEPVPVVGLFDRIYVWGLDN